MTTATRSTTTSTTPGGPHCGSATSGDSAAPPPRRDPIPWARPHRVEPHQARQPGIYGDLVDEWSRLCALPHSGTLRRWAKDEQELGAVRGLTGLLDQIDEAGAAKTDAIFGALLRIAQNGDHLAGRVLLQAMLPKLARQASTTTIDKREADTLEQRRQLGVTTFWEVMAAYPIARRPKSVAGGLALDTLHRLTGITREQVSEVPAPVASASGAYGESSDRRAGADSDRFSDIWDAPDDPTVVGCGPEDDPTGDLVLTVVGDSPDPNGSLLECVAWAVDLQVLTSDQASWLVRVYAPAPGQVGGHAAVAEELGVPVATLRQRCSRAKKSLAEAVRRHVNGDLLLAG